jgi:outer membrane murein-binding lipoprotein Lpp
LFTEAEVAAAVQPLRARLEQLEQENASLRAQRGMPAARAE